MKFLLRIVAIALLAALNVYAQTANVETKHFENAGLAFDYPAEWKLIDSSTNGVTQYTVSPAGGPQQIAVIAQYAPFDASCDFQAASKQITNALVAKSAIQIHAFTPLQTAPVKTQMGVAEIEGVQLFGLVNKRRVTSEVYSLRRSLLFVSLVYLRVDNDARGASAWEVIRKTLTISPNAITVVGAALAKSDTPTTDAPANSPARITGGVLNGRAIHLVQPPYPQIARQAHVSGTVGVQVLIDESGDVIAAHAVTGHPLLQAAAVAAAKASKFSPTRLCDEPVRVTGIIQYSFVAQ